MTSDRDAPFVACGGRYPFMLECHGIFFSQKEIPAVELVYFFLVVIKERKVPSGFLDDFFSGHGFYEHNLGISKLSLFNL